MATPRKKRAASTTRRRTNASSSAKRSAAAKKAAATRKRNASKRSAAAKKAAATRRRRSNAASKPTPRRKKAVRRNPVRKTTARRRTNATSFAKRSAAAKKAARTRKRNAAARSNPSRAIARKAPARKPARRRNPSRSKSARRNPATWKGFMGLVREAATMGAILLPIRAAINWLGNYKLGEGAEEKSVHATIGPFYDAGISALALWAVPKYVLKGGLGKYRQIGLVALQANLLISGMRLLAWYARRDWKASNPVLTPGADNYPAWTDFLEVPEPQAKVEGYSYGRRALSAPRYAQRGSLGLGNYQMDLVYEPASGSFVPAS